MEEKIAVRVLLVTSIIGFVGMIIGVGILIYKASTIEVISNYDVNGDGEVTAQDYVEVKNYIMEN